MVIRPLGLRLPLGSLPINAAGAQEIWPERDPFGDFAPLPERGEAIEKINANSKSQSSVLPDDTQSNAYVKTALSIELNQGMLSLFLPPLQYFEHYLELVLVIEMVAADLGVKN